MKRSTSLIAVVAVLFLGIVVGSLGTHLFYAQRFREHWRGRGGGPGWERGGGFFADRLEERLGLSIEQKEQISQIMEESRREAEELRLETRPRVSAVMERSAERIAEVLTPEQRQEFERLRVEQRERAERFFLDPPRGRRGRGPHGDRPAPPPF